jgi:hypothetical protein
MIAGKGKSPADVVAQYELCLTQVTSLADTDYLGESLSVSLPVYSVSEADYYMMISPS